MVIDDLLRRLGEEGEHETYPSASEDDVRRTEVALGARLPASFCAFVSHFSNGAYLFMLQEVSAVGSGNQQIGAIQDVRPNVLPAGDTALQSPSGDVPAEALVPFSLDHNGNCWCFITSPGSGQEYPVAYCDPEQARLVGQLAGFEEWLRVLVEAQDEVIRTLEDGRLVGELGLG